MRRSACVIGLLTGLAVTAFVLQISNADEKKTPSIKEIMVKAHKTGTGLLPKIGKDLKADELAWDTIQKETKDLVELTGCLEKNKPPKGDKDSWEKLCQSYVKGAKTLDDAAQAKDKAAATAAQRKLAGSCVKCHEAHREDD
jgi:cytochrome c553